ncbi:MAG: response regulator [Bacteroidetes bacterium]|nr:response regulator [Bacteroidota bacterium]
MKASVLIIEDEFPIALDLQTRLEKMEFSVVGIGANYKQAITLLAELDYDLVLLDINLKEEKNGIDLGLIIKEKFFKPIIFITAYVDENTFKSALEAQPMGYVTKPFNDKDLYRNIVIALERFKANNDTLYSENTLTKEADFLFVKDKGVVKRVDCKDVSYIKAMDNYSIINTTKGSYIVNMFLKDILEKLGERFIRIHRSHAVAIDKISTLEDNIVYINKEALIVGSNYKNELLKKMNIL